MKLRESLVPGMTGTVSPRGHPAPSGSGMDTRVPLCAPLPERGRGSQGTGTPSQGSQCHLVGDNQRSGATRPPNLASPASIPIATDPCSSPARPASSPPTLAHPWRLCKAPPRQGRRNLPQVQLVNHIKSSPVESLGVHPAQGESWSESRGSAVSCSLQIH